MYSNIGLILDINGWLKMLFAQLIPHLSPVTSVPLLVITVEPVEGATVVYERIDMYRKKSKIELYLCSVLEYGIKKWYVK